MPFFKFDIQSSFLKEYTFVIFNINSITIKKEFILLIAVALTLILGGIYFSYSPANNAFFPKCPVKFLTGFSCPGCGSQRAVHELLHLNFKKAFEYNALLMVSIPYLLTGIAFRSDKVKTRYPKTENFLFGHKALLIILGVLVIFTVFRNI
ncbi:DUF2752 domain-containing protein [Kaistella sp. DKR-2]|uniref:DUF2752 domain-containing protein n=1 Tax=Kaistella soli TaxID=2849654 RepID=UPI001C273CC5|nr:DUF2752 domain-containing protein [Kaistella soli]MBU8883378.1 DUF2752 domain-containing protein [Kaistella soli]